MRWLRALLHLPPKEESVPLYGPQGVTIVYTDGTTYHDVPSIYTGDDPDDGCAVYEVIPPRAPEDDLPISMTIDVIPAMTSIQFPFKGKPKGTWRDEAWNTFDGDITQA